MNKSVFALVSLLVNFVSSFGADSLRISVDLKHLNHIADSLGSITINVTGGTAPYRYRWDDTGENVSYRSNLYSGNYKVTVSDAQGRSSDLRLELLFEQVHGYYPDDSIVNVADTIRSYIFQNQLSPGSPGFIKYVVNDVLGEQTFGLTTDTIYESLSSGFFINKTKLYIIASNRVAGQFGKVKKGDILTINKENGRISFMKNGQKLSDHQSQEALYRTALHTRRSRVGASQLLSSFNKPLKAVADIVDFTCSTSTRAEISARISGGVGPYTKKIYRGREIAEQNLITGVIPRTGDYTVLISDRVGNQFTVDASVGYQAEWRSTNGFVLSPDSLRKTASEGWCNSRISSLSLIKPDSTGWIEFVVPDTSARIFVGFTEVAGSAAIAGTQGIYVDHDKLLSVTVDQDQGFRKQLLRMISGRTLISVRINNGNLSYIINGELSLQEPILQSVPIPIDVHVFRQGTGINSIRTSYNCER